MSSDEEPLAKRLNTKDELEYEFIQSGKRQRLQEVMVRRLKESGWVSKVELLCKDVIAKKGVERINLEDLVAEVKDPSRKLVPDEVKKELMEHIQQFVYENTDLSPEQK